MQLKDYFTVPSGQKITEKHLRRVLISSICGMLLCMSCLAGTTWAWFTVSIENTNNVIQIGKPEVKLTIDGTALDSGASLSLDGTGLESGVSLKAGTYAVKIEHANDQDDFKKKSDLYVTLTVKSESETIIGYTVLDSNNQYSAVVPIETEVDVQLNWEVSWFAPANATELVDNTINIEALVVPETTETPTDESENESSDSAGNPSGETETPEETPSGETETPPESPEEADTPTEPVSEPTEDAGDSDKSQPSVPSTEVPDDTSTEASTEPSSQPSTDVPTDEET